MLKEIIDAGLTISNVISLYNNNREKETGVSDREDNKKRQNVRKNISDFRNAAYILRHFVK